MDNYAEALSSWQQAFQLIQQLKPADTSDLIQALLDEQLFPKFKQTAVRAIICELFDICTTAQVIPELGVALIRNLKVIQDPTISDYTATEWLKLWQEVGASQPEMKLVLKALEVGIKYKKDPQDGRIFLSIPQEMRSILREALGLAEISPTG